MYPKTRLLCGIAALILLLVTTRTTMAETMFRTPLTLEGRYDTNANTDAKGEESSDFIITASPQLELTHTRKRTEFTANYRFTSRTFMNNPDFNDISHSAALVFGLTATEKLSFTIADRLTYTPNAFSIEELSDLQVQIRKSDIFYNNFSIGTAYSPTHNTHIGVTLTESLLDFRDASLIDTKTQSASISISHDITPDTSVNTSYGYSSITYNTPVTTHSEIHSLSMGFSTKPFKTVSTSFSGGATYTPGTSSDFDWIANATLAKEFKNSSASAGYTRGVTHSTGLTDELTISNRGTLNWSKPFSKALNMSIAGSLANTKSKPSGALDADSYSVSVSGSWLYSDWITLGFGYSHFQQWANEGSTGDDFLGDSVYFSITATPFERRL